MSYSIQISQVSAVPKYRQVANSIIMGIQTRTITTEEQLPSINELSSEYDLSRDTVEKAYRLLKKEGVILSVRGKGYFVAADRIAYDRKILMVFNKLSTYKQEIYNSFAKIAGDLAWIDLQVYYEDFRLFERIIREKAGKFTDYVIIPSFQGEDELRACTLLNECFHKPQLLLLSNHMDGLRHLRGGVYQNYEKDIQNALNQLKNRLAKYKQLHLVFPFQSKYPRSIIYGFQTFCRTHGFESLVTFNNFYATPLECGTAYIVVKDEDLVSLVKKVKSSCCKPGEEVGILAYNDSPLKEVLLNGITVMTTDHKAMGEAAARMILENNRQELENSFRIIERGSL
jgi:DNA-binding transcriptional regulator YhcF (GntR family)